MGNSNSVSLPDLAATQALALRLARVLRAGDTVFLTGDLGAGKTTFARTIIQTLCGVDDAPSPTYTLIQTYDWSGGELWHADLYRIEDASELDELGLDDAFGDAIMLVEWPDRLFGQAPDDRLELDLEMLGDSAGDSMDRPRRAGLTGFGEWETRLDDI
ncbi:tRNA threonylcarbamoyladenosine biosynthesis protein TsaE [Maricaulis sp. W15]|uniref:tRNA threonylcarbamoyladenosine biosynthesis protein TsaE n=1 Tax=Maricaulis maris TaxID=74318 RepID=A0A495D2K5_9PROT|nr:MULTISPECIES: tRNA (adenosine(37)-N6)-threonylcarbamoyltransferase complex ATPase subunit type 1 TsaE [Maricaulis]OLF71445.1 tRNA threonylcarbamoyladenosine biosynthesis protein TsaE [Maricaulis sp. W15]RKQ96015.1 tRNA threonylcarbamoyladenosine biosynthesis protein TsaE [Maricaulis maris]